ncbi:hypothetical protein Taro_047118 [Colocasia esculenta]|uniref:Uncharacterized protein n=1 Tax=Colocasia esculenta TaxID=4460 RepID=A0A843X3E2_COLES|nr:hypothetical protein [Colocasia esculenta]
MVKKAQLLEDVTDFTYHINGRIVMKEQASSSSSRPTNSKKQLFNIIEGPSHEGKPKIATPFTPNKTNCKHCDKPSHNADKYWRKVSACLQELDVKPSCRQDLQSAASDLAVNILEWPDTAVKFFSAEQSINSSIMLGLVGDTPLEETVESNSERGE